MLRARLAPLIVILLVTGGLAACSSSPAPKPTTTLTYWAANMTATPAQDANVLEPELAKFTKQTGIKVRLQVQRWATLYSQLLTAIAGHQLPDVIDIGNTWSAALQATGAFQPFGDSSLSTLGGRRRFLTTSLSSTGAAGQPPISIPLYGQAYGLFYNPAMFAAAGIAAPPTTWAEFVADAKKLTKPGQWGVALPGASSTVNAHMAFILGRQQGSELFGAAGHPQFDTPAEQAAVKQYLDLMTVDKVVNPDAAEDQSLDALNQFAQGKAAMTLTQISSRSYFDSVKFTGYAVAQVPTVQPTPPGGAAVESIVAGTNLTISKDSAHQAAALKLVQFLTSDAEQTTLNKAFGTLPVVNDLRASPAFADPITKTFTTILAEHSQAMPMLADEGTMETLVGDAISGLWAKAATGGLSDSDISAALAAANQNLTADGN